MNDEELLAWVEGLVKGLADEYGSEPDDQRGLEALRARLSLQQSAGWQPIETAQKDVKAIFWVRPGTVGDGKYFCDTSGKPILSNCSPHLHVGPYGSWSSLMLATHWMPLPEAPRS